MKKRKPGFLPVVVPSTRPRVAMHGIVPASSSGASASSSSSSHATHIAVPDPGVLSESQVDDLIALGLMPERSLLPQVPPEAEPLAPPTASEGRDNSIKGPVSVSQTTARQLGVRKDAPKVKYSRGAAFRSGSGAGKELDRQLLLDEFNDDVYAQSSRAPQASLFNKIGRAHV